MEIFFFFWLLIYRQNANSNSFSDTFRANTVNCINFNKLAAETLQIQCREEDGGRKLKP